ncbi:MAG: alpha-2-macroglobulin family protein [Betaproteobacteria bacterium]|nr:alpha-2-macroglobulin family protein [Betaproteobacteria bacterium]
MRTKLIILALLTALVLAGVLVYRSLAPDAPPAPGADGKFVLVDAAERALDGSPALSLTFSQPLDPRTHYDRFIEVFEMPPRLGERQPRSDDPDAHDPEARDARAERKKPLAVSTAAEDTEVRGGNKIAHAWVVGENRRLLYFPHVKPETRYVVRVQPGLTAAGGAALDAEARYSVRTEAVSPAFYFAARGMVLPARQNGGLPIVTVNVPEVDIQFLRVRPGQLARFLDRVITPARKASNSGSEHSDEDAHEARRDLRGAIDTYHLDQLRTLAESVYLGRFLAEQKPNKRSVTYIPVEELKELKEPGIYVAVMSEPGRFRYEYQTTYFYVSDLGLHVRLFDASADAYVSALTDAKAIASAEIQWLDAQGRIVARAETDADGRAHFAERPKNARVVLARKGENFSLIALREPALDLSEYDVLGMPYKPVRLFAYAGRDLYRPGEHFELSVVARDFDGRPVPEQPIQAILKRPDGRTHFTASWPHEAAFPGYYRRRIELPADAPTGFWTLELRADPADAVPATVWRFGVEEFLPERMKLDVATAHAFLDPQHAFALDVRGAYLYGAPAAKNRLLAVVQYERSRNPLAAKLPGFEFGDANEDGAKTRQELPEVRLDASGNAKLEVDLKPVAERTSPFSVRATLSLLESGGRPVVRSIERVHWPAPILLGVRPLFGDYARENSPVEFEVVRVDATGAMTGVQSAPVRLFREDRHYYWRFEDQRGWHSGFTETEELVETATVTIPAGGRGKLMLPVRYGRYRLEIADPQTGLTLRYRFYAGWSARTDEAAGTRPDRVALKLDKPAYSAGSTAQLTVTPPHAGELLLSVEGDRTLWVKRMPIATSGATVAIPIAAEWQRHDLYVTAAVLRPGNEGDRVTPARALGIVHVPLERAARKLAVSVQAAAKTVPETPLEVTVRAAEAKNERAFVTLYAVDAGILNITRFATPDPHAFFFAKLRYGADLHDVYGRIIEKMPGSRGRLKFGGDNTPKPTRSLPKKVKLVDLFSGPVALDAQGEARISLPLPDFNGTLRLMAMVATPERFGSHEAEVTVAAPLVAELLTPRFLTAGDRATIALDLHNLSGEAQKLAVEVLPAEGLRVGDASRRIALADQEKATLRFPVETGSAFGLTEVRVTIASEKIHLERQFALEVVAATPRQQTRKHFTVAPGESIEIRAPELNGYLRASVQAHVVVSDQPPIDVRSALRGLLTYPYGCAEQTTSTAYPHLLIDEAGAARFGLKPYSREQRVVMVDKAIGRLSAMQAPNGGFSLWGRVSEYEYWLSAYVSHFLLDARSQGFGVPNAMHKRALDFLLRGLQEGISGLPATTAGQKPIWNETAIWNDRRYAGSGRFAVLAYGAYVLARESRAPLGTLRQLFESRTLAHSGLALVHLGIALKLMGDDARGDQAIAEGLRKPRESGYWWGDYGSTLRDAAMSYALLGKHRITAEGRDNLLAVMAGEMKRPEHWYSTQEKLGLFLVGREFGDAQANMQWRAQWDTAAASEAVAAKGSWFKEVNALDLAGGMKLTNLHGSKLFVELAYSGHPLELPVAERKDFELKRTLFTAEGSALGSRPLRVGESIIVRLQVKSRGRIANGLVVDRIPAGLEIENLNIVQGERFGGLKIEGIDVGEAMKNPRIQHVEFRDDRFVAAVRLERDTVLFYRARVVTPGRFVVPPVYVEDMYRPQTFGIGEGGEVLDVVDASK